MYYNGFGTGIVDNCIVAEEDDRVIGAVRLHEKVGFKTVDEHTEEYIMGHEL